MVRSMATTVDVDLFVTAAVAATAAATSDPGNLQELVLRSRAAVDAYGGDLLEGDYDEWLRGDER